MIGKKINQLATELAPESTDLTIIGDPTTGVSKKITIAQLGAIFSGAVSFYNDLASFPVSGDINVIYCAKDTQKLYLWSGSAYVEVFPSQALLDTYQLRSEKGNANGYASLDSLGKVPISQLPSSIMEYKGTWNAATNTPTLANGTGDTGDVYICNVAGTVNFGAGPITFAVGDYVIYSGTIWQRSSGAVGTVTSVAASITGDSVTISGSPVTTSGTLAFAFNGTTAQYIRGNGTLETFPSLTGFVPYTGATANVDLGTHTLIAAKGTFSSSGSGDTVGITHSSGSGIALNITKGGNGEGLYINKTSGSGNAATIIGTLNATTLVKSGGTSTQFLKADGSVDSSTYLTTSDASSLYLPLTGGTLTGLLSINSALRIKSGAANGVLLETYNTNQLVVRVTPSSTTYDSTLIFPSNSRNYTFPDASGTLALVGGSGVGTVTSVGALTIGTSGTDLSSTVANGTTTPVITLNVPTASATNRGALSSTDWTTFNNKQNALTNPVTGTGTNNFIPKFTTTGSTIGNSTLQEVSGNLGLGVSPSAWFTSAKAIQVLGAALEGRTTVTQLWCNGYVDAGASGNFYQYNGFASKYTQAFGEHQFFTAPSGTAGNAISFTQAMTLNASGNLSIGNTNDTFKLDVTGTGRFTGALTGTSATFSTNGDNITLNNPTGQYTTINFRNGGVNKGQIYWDNAANRFYVTDNLWFSSTGAATFSSSLTIGNTFNINASAWLQFSGNNVLLADSGDTFLQASGTGSIIFRNNAAARIMTMTNGGNVGIGLTNPAYKLHISGGNGTQLLLDTTSQYCGVDIANATSVKGGLSWDNTNAIFGLYTNGSIPMTFQTNNTERLRITSGGYLKASNNGSYGGATNPNHEIRNNNGGWGVLDVTHFATSNPYGLSINFSNASPNNTSNFFIYSADATEGKFVVWANGDVDSRTNSYGGWSDIKLKENISDATPKLNDLLKVKVKNYNFIGDDKKQLGVVAQELEEIFPALISETPDYEINKETGVKVNLGTTTKSVKYSVFVPMLIKAIQEQQEQINELKLKLNK